MIWNASTGSIVASDMMPPRDLPSPATVLGAPPASLHDCIAAWCPIAALRVWVRGCVYDTNTVPWLPRCGLSHIPARTAPQLTAATLLPFAAAVLTEEPTDGGL